MNNHNLLKYFFLIFILLQVDSVEAKISLKIKEIIDFDSTQYLIITSNRNKQTIKILTKKKKSDCNKKNKLKVGNTYKLNIIILEDFIRDGFLVRHIVFIDGKKILDINENVYMAENLIGLCVKI